MNQSSNVEYCFLEYVPTVLNDESVPMAAIFIDSSDPTGICSISISANWKRNVRVSDPDADLEMVAALLSEIRTRLLSSEHRAEMIRQLGESFSNVIQVSPRRRCSAAPKPDSIEIFARKLLGETSTESSGPTVVYRDDITRIA